MSKIILNPQLWTAIISLFLFTFSIDSFAQCQIKPYTNLVINSEFNTGIQSWTLMKGLNTCTTTSNSSFYYDNNALKITVHNNYQGCNPFNWRTFILGDMVDTLHPNMPYVFTFKVKTNSSMPISFDAAVRLKSPPYSWIISFNNKDIKAINQWQQFCKPDLRDSIPSQISGIEIAFFFGDVPDGTEIWIDDVYVGEPAGFIEDHKIRVNQLGYFVNLPKDALSVDSCNTFTIKTFSTNSAVYTGKCQKLGIYPQTHPAVCDYERDTIWRLDFTNYNIPGQYYLETDNGNISYPFVIGGDVYSLLKKDVFRFFYFQRCGQPLSSSLWGNLARPTCHSQDTNASMVDTSFNFLRYKNVSGGWHDAGDYVKYTFNNAITTVFLAKSYLENPLAFSDNEDIPESGNGIPDIVDELALNAQFLFKMQDTNNTSPDFGGVYSKVSTQQWDVYALPHVETTTRYLTPPTTISTAGFIAAMCHLYRVFISVPTYRYLAEACSIAAFRGWNYLMSHFQSELDSVNNPKGGFIKTATYDWYPDIDERIWAAAELYRTFQNIGANMYFISNYKHCNSIFLDNDFYSHYQTSSSCITMRYHQHYAWLGFLSYMEAQNPDRLVKSDLNQWLYSQADTISNRINNDYFSFSLRTWGDNYALLYNAMILKKMFDITANPIYLISLNKNIDYLLGKNITGYSFITGHGSKTPVYLNHLQTRNDSYSDIPYGALVGGVSATAIAPPPLPVKFDYGDPSTYYFDTCTIHAKRYLDFPMYPFRNEPAINYNAVLLYALYSLSSLVTSVSDELENFTSSFIAYPTPSNGKFIVKVNKSNLTECDIMIYNVLGQKVYDATNIVLNHLYVLDLSSLSEGMYFVSVKLEKILYIQKIYIQK